MRDFDKLPLRSASEDNNFLDGNEVEREQACELNLETTFSGLLDMGRSVDLEERRDMSEQFDNVDDTGREQEAADGESREDSEKYFELVLESEEMESGERYGGEEEEDDEDEEFPAEGDIELLTE